MQGQRAHTHIHTHAHPAGRYFLSALFPSATVGYDAAEITAGEVMARGEMRSRDGHCSQRKHYLDKSEMSKQSIQEATRENGFTGSL